MKKPDETTAKDFPTLMYQIRDSGLPDAKKLAKAFDWITTRYMEHAQQEIELVRAMNDREALVKEQIKLEMMKSVREMLQDCYKILFGGSAWDE